MPARFARFLLERLHAFLFVIAGVFLPRRIGERDFHFVGSPEIVERTQLKVKVMRSEGGEVVFLPDTFRVKREYAVRVKSELRSVELGLPAHSREEVAHLLRRLEEARTAEGRTSRSRRSTSRLEYARDGQLQLLVRSSRETPIPSESLFVEPGLAFLRRRLVAWNRMEHLRATFGRKIEAV